MSSSTELTCSITTDITINITITLLMITMRIKAKGSCKSIPLKLSNLIFTERLRESKMPTNELLNSSRQLKLKKRRNGKSRLPSKMLLVPELLSNIKGINFGQPMKQNLRENRSFRLMNR
jgi:hypothetical protein